MIFNVHVIVRLVAIESRRDKLSELRGRREILIKHENACEDDARNNEWTEPLLADCRRSNTLGSQRSADRHARYYGNQRQRALVGLHARTRLLEGARMPPRGPIAYICIRASSSFG